MINSPLYQQKLVYLVLLDDITSFDKLRRDLFIDDVPSLYKALRFLALNKLIYSHPVLLEKSPRRVHFRKAASLNLEVLDRSPRVLHWCLTNEINMVDNMPRDWYINEIKKFAKDHYLEIIKADRLKCLFLD